MSYAEVEMKVIQWSEARQIIPNSTPLAQAKKAKEEVQELYDALVLNDREAAIDGVGDTMVCLINVCALMDVSLTDCLEAAYTEIKDRKGFLGKDGIYVKQAV